MKPVIDFNEREMWRDQMRFQLKVDDDETMNTFSPRSESGDMERRTLSLIGRSDDVDHIVAIVVYGCTQLEADTRAHMLASAWKETNSRSWRRRRARRKAKRAASRPVGGRS